MIIDITKKDIFKTPDWIQNINIKNPTKLGTQHRKKALEYSYKLYLAKNAKIKNSEEIKRISDKLRYYYNIYGKSKEVLLSMDKLVKMIPLTKTQKKIKPPLWITGISVIRPDILGQRHQIIALEYYYDFREAQRLNHKDSRFLYNMLVYFYDLYYKYESWKEKLFENGPTLKELAELFPILRENTENYTIQDVIKFFKNKNRK